MADIHAHLKHLSPIDYSSIPDDDSSLATYIREALSHSQALVDSVPPPPTDFAPSTSSSTPNVASSLSDISTNSQLTSDVPTDASLQKPWGKPLKLSSKENPLHIAVYKLAAADRRGAWFARRSVHEGLGFARWKRALDTEFEESLKVHGEPGQGNVRGIGAEKVLVERKVEGLGEVSVMQLTAKFPGPSAARDFVELMVSSTTNVGKEDAGEKGPRQYLLVTRPVTHPEAPERSGWVRGQYESVEFIREIPVRKTKRVGTDGLPATVNGDGNKEKKDGGEPNGEQATTDTDLLGAKAGKISVEDAQATIEANKANGEEVPAESSKGDTVDMPIDEEGELSPHPIEWIMITRSDPGGSVPKFMVERGTPGAIVSDAGKFLEWATHKEMPVQPSNGAAEQSSTTHGEEEAAGAAAGTATAAAAARHAHSKSLTRTITSNSTDSSDSSDSFVSADSGTPTVTPAASNLSTASGSDKYTHQENELQKKLQAKKAKEEARLEETKAKHGDNESKIKKGEDRLDRKTQEADNWYEKEMGKIQAKRAKDERKQGARERKAREKAEAGDMKLQMEHLKEENEQLRSELEKLKGLGKQ